MENRCFGDLNELSVDALTALIVLTCRNSMKKALTFIDLDPILFQLAKYPKILKDSS